MLRKLIVACITVCPIVFQHFWKSIVGIPLGPGAFHEPNWKAAFLISFMLNSLSNICRCRCKSHGSVYSFKASIVVAVLVLDSDWKMLWKCCYIWSLSSWSSAIHWSEWFLSLVLRLAALPLRTIAWKYLVFLSPFFVQSFLAFCAQNTSSIFRSCWSSFCFCCSYWETPRISLLFCIYVSSSFILESFWCKFPNSFLFQLMQACLTL